tara:strand:+ start:1300 stop:1572 length:273 start_codon:yes stop_codon:yes gene_type:complete
MTQNVKNIKITLDMVRYWLGWSENEGAKTLRDIANSKNEDKPWTPDILYNDIIESWKERPEDWKEWLSGDELQNQRREFEKDIVQHNETF